MRPEGTQVPVRVVGRFTPIGPAEWKRLDNNSKAALGKARFLEMPGTADATPAEVSRWLATVGLAVERSNWVPVSITSDLPPRYVNVGYSTRCFDAFTIDADGVFQGAELKVSGYDGVCALSVSEERLLRAGLIRIFLVNPVRGLIGEMDTNVLLSVPRRVDGVPVGEARAEWAD